MEILRRKDRTVLKSVETMKPGLIDELAGQLAQERGVRVDQALEDALRQALARSGEDAQTPASALSDGDHAATTTRPVRVNEIKALQRRMRHRWGEPRTLDRDFVARLYE